MLTAIIFSNLNVLSLNLVEFLLGSNCRVYVVSQDFKSWKESLPDYSKSDNLIFFEDNRFLPRDARYVFSVNGFGFDPEEKYIASNIEKNFSWAVDYAKNFHIKLCLVLPYLQVNNLQITVNNFYNFQKNSLPPNYLTFFVGEVYGLKMQLSDGGLATRMIKDSVFSSVVTLPTRNQDIFLIAASDAVSEIVKNLFSFGSDYKEIALTESDSAYNLFDRLTKIKPSLSFAKENIPSQKHVGGLTIMPPTKKDKDTLAETISWLSQYANFSVEVKTKQQETPALGRKKNKQKSIITKFEERANKVNRATSFVLASSAFLLFIVLSPFLALGASAVGMNYSYKQIKNGQIAPVRNTISASTFLARFSKASLMVYANTPLVGEFFEFSQNLAGVLESSGKIALQSQELIDLSNKLSKSILGEGDYGLNLLSGTLTKKSIDLEKDLLSLERKMTSIPPSIRSKLPEEKIKELAKYLTALSDLSPRLPELLGLDAPKTYLITFQNNMELRPTGGFIGSFALVTFTRGKLADINVMDVYTADGQLKGHIEPPYPIKSYLGEVNWFLRDSNWDPDFPTSAIKAEWFLDKELERNVDGVIAVDLEVSKSILQATGPVTLADFQETLDYKNMYDKIQYEVESDFFPGSTKKASLLTSLAKALLEKIRTVNGESQSQLAANLFENLKQKHIQIYLHDAKAQAAISKAGLSGEVRPEKCKTVNCQNVLVSLNEANVGVNKANYFVEREVSLETKVLAENIENKLTVNLINKAVPALGLKGKYKTYVRVLSDKESRFSGIEIKESSGSKFPNIEEENLEKYASAGTLVEVQPGQTKTVVFTWSQDTSLLLTKPGTLNISFLKQAGTNPFPISVSLTMGREVSYNTVLAEDRVFQFIW